MEGGSRESIEKVPPHDRYSTHNRYHRLIRDLIDRAHRPGDRQLIPVGQSRPVCGFSFEDVAVGSAGAAEEPGTGGEAENQWNPGGGNRAQGPPVSE